MQKQQLHKYLRSRIAASPDGLTAKAYYTARKLWRSAHTRRIALDRLLCGGEQGMNGRQFALHTNDLRRASTPISQSPHSLFLKQYQQIGDRIFEPEILEQTAYYRNATTCMRVAGAYFSMTSDDQVVDHLRSFVKRFKGEAFRGNGTPSSDCYSEADQPVLAFPIKYSDCFQVLDGNHRLAIAVVNGQKTIPVRIVPDPQLTCLQQLLLDVSWNLNKRHLYQPIQSRELGNQWQLVRCCTDRLNMMKKFLSEQNLLPPQTQTYLDIACNYGWFVKSMGEIGYKAGGLELDWAARQIGIHFYGLTEDQITRSEVVRYFRSQPAKRDVVSCFSLLHHFVMGRGAVSAEQLIRWLDEITDKVLFFEMGDEGEAWFRRSLAGWNPGTIAQWLKEKTTFSRIIPLGTDEDRVPPYEDNYHRTLFACVR